MDDVERKKREDWWAEWAREGGSHAEKVPRSRLKPNQARRASLSGNMHRDCIWARYLCRNKAIACSLLHLIMQHITTLLRS